MKTTVITAVFDDYDDPKPHPDIDNVEWLLITDHERVVDGWTVLVDSSLPKTVHPRLAAKVPKFMPWKYAPDADRWLWIDASCIIVDTVSFGTDFVTWAFGDDTESDARMFQHPWRDDISQEANVSVGMHKYVAWPVQQQAATYKANGLETPSGLFATGVIAWRDTKRARALGASWMLENCFWTYQDQISLPWCIRQTGAKVTPLQGQLDDTARIVWASHHRED